MQNTTIEKNSLSIDPDNGLVDLDHIAAKMDSLNGEITVYRTSIVRHLQARCDLLGKPEWKDDDSLTIKQLLELKETLDAEFREKFRLTDTGFNRSSSAVSRRINAGDFLSGRGR